MTMRDAWYTEDYARFTRSSREPLLERRLSNPDHETGGRNPGLHSGGGGVFDAMTVLDCVVLGCKLLAGTHGV